MTSHAQLARAEEKRLHGLVVAGEISEARKLELYKSWLDENPYIPDRLPTPNPKDVLIPGGHRDDQGDYIEQSVADFARQCISAMPPDRLWRRGRVPGELQGPPGSKTFEALDGQRTRLLIGDHCRLVHWVTKKETRDRPEPQHVQVYNAATRDHGDIVLASAADHKAVRDIRVLVSYPVFAPDLAHPGFNHGGIYYDEPPALRDLEPTTDPAKIQATLNDLVIDFPFQEQSDRENFFGLLLTPLLRPAIDGNVPLHFVTAPVQGTGKTKLVEEILGGVYLGQPLQAQPFPVRDEEREKYVLSMLMKGQTIANLDNAEGFLDSPVLAAMITATRFEGRILGHSRMVTVDNRMTLAMTGNNPRMTGELARRAVPIRLLPNEARPENRTDFVHADLRAYVAKSRREILEALIGAVTLWKRVGSPPDPITLGSFEGWSRAVGGILRVLGYRSWLTNLASWAEDADDFTQELNALIGAWAARRPNERLGAAELVLLADEIEVFQWITGLSKTPKAIQTMFGNRVMAKAVGRVFGEHRVVRITQGSGGAKYALAPKIRDM